MKRSKLKILISSVIAVVAVGIYFLHNSGNLSAAIVDCTNVSGNLIQNCSFENASPLPAGALSSVTYPGYGYTVYDGYTGITNWDVIAPISGSNIAIIDYPGVSPHGNRFIDVSGVDEPTAGVNGEQPGSGIQQTVGGLVSGQKYELSFYHAGNSYNDINVLINGTSQGVFTVTPASVGDIIGSLKWVRQSTVFTATGTSALVTFRNDLIYGSNTEELDNIALVAVRPTPTVSAPVTVYGPFTASVTFDAPVTGLQLSNFSISNGTASGLSSAVNNMDGTQTYSFTVTPITSGAVTISVPATSSSSSSPVTSIGNAYNVASNTTSSNYDPDAYYSNVHIESNNTNHSYATIGNVVTLSYTMQDTTPVVKQTVSIGGILVTPVCSASVSVVGGQDCSAAILVSSSAPLSEGLVLFSVYDDANLQLAAATTDGSYVIVDRIAPIVTITSPTPGSTVTGLFTLTGTCESGLPVVITAGSPANYKPPLITTACTGGTYSAAITPTGAIGSTIHIGLIQQTDAAGNQSPALSADYLIGAPYVPVITITGPSGTTAAGMTNVTGECDPTRVVTITGTGFDPVTGTAPCTGGTYSYPVTITGNTTFSACQRYSTMLDGASTFEDRCAYGSTMLPVVTSTGGGTSSGGCIYATGCEGVHLDFNNPTVVSAPVVAPVITSTCPKFTQYLRKGNRDGDNGITEVSKVQSFLNKHLGINLPTDGVFGIKTFQAVATFQSTYLSNILAPWNLSGPTGWWYESTRHYANLIEGCPEGTTVLDNGVIIRDGEIVK